MNTNNYFWPLLANRYNAEAACVCESVQTWRSQIEGLRSCQIKTHAIAEKMESQKNYYQIGLDSIVLSKCSLLSPDIFWVDLKVSAPCLSQSCIKWRALLKQRCVWIISKWLLSLSISLPWNTMRTTWPHRSHETERDECLKVRCVCLKLAIPRELCNFLAFILSSSNEEAAGLGCVFFIAEHYWPIWIQYMDVIVSTWDSDLTAEFWEEYLILKIHVLSKPYWDFKTCLALR